MPKYINAPETKYELSLFFICDKEEGESVTLEEIEQVIDRMPSADVVEVKYGCWKCLNNDPVNHSGDLLCSECRCMSHMRTDFCPHCGADMRERKEAE